MIPFYDPRLSYEDNYQLGPFGLFAKLPNKKFAKSLSKSFLGFSVDSLFGIPAGPLLNSKFVIGAWNWGFSISTYKTVRGDIYPCHPHPNVIKVKSKKGSIFPGETVIGMPKASSIDVTRDGITNSFGVPSRPSLIWQKDVQAAISKMKKGRLMILSFMGTKKDGMTRDEYIKDFARTCKLAKATGAPVLEVNFSCPNVGKEGLICNDVKTSKDLLEAMRRVRGNVPLLVKIGYFPKNSQRDLEKLLYAIYHFADGVAAINTIQAKVVDTKGNQVLPGSAVRLMSGICGAAIRWAGLEMAERIVEYKKKKGWKNFVVVGVGGVTRPEDYFRYISLGVDAVQSATGAMWNPRLALEIRKKL